jgi:hypothetical protein
MRLSLLFFVLLIPTLLHGTEEAYPRTPVGVVETKTLPAARLLRTRSPKGYFESNNGLFMNLFRYIQANKIPMTAPVEAGIQPGTMFFYVHSTRRDRLDSSNGVDPVEAPARSVAAIGVRGSYTKKNFDTALTQLKAWLAQRPTLIPQGEPYAVYWNSPFVPGFLKHSEVHIPLTPASERSKSVPVH